MNKQYIQNVFQAILEGDLDKAKESLNKGLEARFKSMLHEQAHRSQHTWVSDVKQRGATKFAHKGSPDAHATVALTDDGKEVGTWHKGHGGFTHKPAEPDDEHHESAIGE